MSGHQRRQSGGQPDNPPRPMPAGTDPAKFPVQAKSRPKELADLLSHKEVMYFDWEHDVGNRQLYYLDGIVAFMRMVRGRRIAFMKEDSLPGQTGTCVDLAVKAVRTETAWTTQADLPWDGGLSANQLRRMRDRKAVVFTKPVYAIVACEHALRALMPSVSPFWVYDYMRITPAVYNIDRFNQDVVSALESSPNGAAKARDLAGLDGLDVLKDLAAGHCVTAMTAYDVADYVNKNVLVPAQQNPVGPVRFKPGRRRLGRKDASPNEEVDIR